MYTKNVFQGGWLAEAKMTSLGGKLTALVYHLTIKVNKTEKLTYLSTNIEYLSHYDTYTLV
jgi:hypothetical protein